MPAVGLPGAIVDDLGGGGMHNDGMRGEQTHRDDAVDDEVLPQSHARIRKTLDEAVSRETDDARAAARDEADDVPQQRSTYNDAYNRHSYDRHESTATHAAHGWTQGNSSSSAVGRAAVGDSPSGSITTTGREAPVASGPAGGDSSTRSGPSYDAVSRETEPDEEPPLAREARRAMDILNPSGEAMLPRPPKRRVVCIANQKGGVGKTTTAVNLAVSLALHGSRVLLIDLDPQGNASTGLGVEHHSGVPSVYECLLGESVLADVAQQVTGIPNLYCAPATIDLAGAEVELVSIVARESRLGRAIDAHTADLDYVFIDCPPSLGLLTVNALVAAEEVLIPIQCEYYALEGLGQLLRNIELVKAHLNQRLNVSTIMLTMYDRRTKLADQVEREVRGHFGDVVLETVIPRSVRVSEAPSYGESVITYDPGSRGAVSYFGAAKEIADRGVRTGEGR
ncbi:MAG: ParA family protein [Micromonosporaceae bacterium]